MPLGYGWSNGSGKIAVWLAGHKPHPAAKPPTSPSLAFTSRGGCIRFATVPLGDQPDGRSPSISWLRKVAYENLEPETPGQEFDDVAEQYVAEAPLTAVDLGMNLGSDVLLRQPTDGISR